MVRKMKNIIEASNELWNSVITNIDVDVLKQSIVFELAVTDSGKTQRHILRIMNYESFMWINTDKNNTFPEMDYYEITSIQFGSVNIESNHKWLSQFPIDFNITIEIWETAFLIKADSIMIDNCTFVVS